MKTINLTILCLASVIIFSCKGKNDKPIDSAPDTNASLIDEDNSAVTDDNTSSSSTATYTDNVDGTVDNINSGMGAGLDNDMNIKKGDMYKKLDMTEEQIQKYEAASKKHQETIKNNKDIKQNAEMQQRDNDMKAVLSTSQYTRYKDMIKDYYKDQDSTQTKKQ